MVRSDDTTLLGIVDRAVGSLTEVGAEAVINGNVLRERPVDLGRARACRSGHRARGGVGNVLIVVLFVLIILTGCAREATRRPRSTSRSACDMYALCDDSFFEFVPHEKADHLDALGKANKGSASRSPSSATPRRCLTRSASVRSPNSSAAKSIASKKCGCPIRTASSIGCA